MLKVITHATFSPFMVLLLTLTGNIWAQKAKVFNKAQKKVVEQAFTLRCAFTQRVVLLRLL